MAKENATVNLYINNAQAKVALAELEKSYQELKKARKAADKAGDNDKSLELKAKELNEFKKLEQARKGTLDVETVLGNLSVLNTNQLIEVKRKLRKELSLINRDTDEYRDKLAVVKKIEAELATTQGKRSKIMSQLTPTISVDQLVGKAIGQVNNAVDAYAEYDDKLADVRKTTGLTKEGVEALSVSLSKIDTRSSQNELLGLASQAGKLGVSGVEDVERFTIAADKIGVALGEDLGDKEQAINSIGKLVDIFKLKDQYGFGDAMLKIGSAINSLGAASAASEGYIVDFLSRTGGIAVSANLSSTAIMGLGATFSSLNQPVEASATVMNKLIGGMFSKTSEYAKVAKMSIKEFSQLLKTDANEALLAVLEGMKGQDLGYTAQMLGEVGENGARAASTVALIADKIDMVRAQQELARLEFEKGTSILDEFEIKNNTAAANREKQRKETQAALVALGQKLQPIVDMFYSGSITAIKALRMLLDVVYEYKGVIAAVSVVVGGYVAWQKLKAFWSAANCKATLKEIVAMKTADAALKKGTIMTALYTTKQKALIAVKALLAGQFRAAGIAAKAFFVSLGPIGWAITAITGVVTVMALLKATTSEVSGAYAELGVALRREDNTYEDLKQRLKETTDGTTERAGLIKLINELYSDYLPNLLTEKSTTEEIATALDNATGAMKRNIAEKIRASETEKAEQALYEAKKQAVDTLLESYAESGDRTAGQMALAAQRFSAAIDLIDKTPTTGKERVAAVNTLLSAMGERLIWSVADIQAAQISLFGNGGPIAQADDALTNYAESYERYIKSIRTTNALFPNSSDEKKKEKIVVDKVLCEKCGKNPCECYKVTAQEAQAWTLESDQKFSEQRVALKRKQLAGEYATEESYARDMLNLEITTLETRIATNKDKGAELAKIKEQLLDKQITKAKEYKKREEDLLKIAQGGDTELQKAQREHDELLRAKGLFQQELSTMTAAEKAAYLQIERDYATKLSAINLTQITKELDTKKKALEQKTTAIRLAQSEELATVDTFEKKMTLLRKWFSAEELRGVVSTKEADKLIKAKYAEDQQTATKDELTKLIATYTTMADEVDQYGGLFDNAITWSDEDRQKLEDIINELRKKLAELKQDPTQTPKNKSVDVLGMSADDWGTMFQNTEGGLSALDKMEVAAKAIGSAFSDVSNLMAAIEQRDLKNYEKSQNKKKQALDRQLKAGAISQEGYNAKVQAIDEQTEAKRLEMERKQAERQKAMAIFSAISSTAVAVVSALGSQPFGPWNIALASLVGALGAVQIATIIAQPLPGAEQGGWMDVVREQDGKPFRARRDENKRGAVSAPTVIVGENGTEYVVPAEGYRNPTVRPLLDAIERARLSGRLGSIDLGAVMQANTVQGRAQGGTISPTHDTNVDPTPAAGAAYLDGEVAKVLTLVKQSVDKLNDRLNAPITAEVVMTGERGLAKQYDKFNNLRNRATIGRRP